MPTKRMLCPSSRNRGGFSLLELMVILAVIGAVAVTVVPKLAGVILKAKTTQCAANRTILERAEERYRADHDGQSSAGLEALYSERYVDRAPRCSAGGFYIWITTSTPVDMGCSVHEWQITVSATPETTSAPTIPAVEPPPAPDKPPKKPRKK